MLLTSFPIVFYSFALKFGLFCFKFVLKQCCSQKAEMKQQKQKQIMFCSVVMITISKIFLLSSLWVNWIPCASHRIHILHTVHLNCLLPQLFVVWAHFYLYKIRSERLRESKISSEAPSHEQNEWNLIVAMQGEFPKKYKNQRINALNPTHVQTINKAATKIRTKSIYIK